MRRIRIVLLTLPILVLIVIMMLTGCSSGKAADQPTGSGESIDNPVTPSALLAEDTAEPSTEPSTEPSSDSSFDESTFPVATDWTVVSDISITHPTNIAGFLNENYGLTVGYDGEIHYTNDGGKTWPRAQNSSMCRFCLDIVDENLAWSGGNGNNVRVTEDGGKIWRAVTDADLGGKHSNIDFVDGTTGWLVSQTNCSVTKDGGATWTPLALPVNLKNIASICLRTASDGYILSNSGLFFETTDGGTTWNEQDLGFKDYGIVDQKNQPGLYKNIIALSDISFTDEKNGTIVFTGPIPGQGVKTWCLTTADGGATWTSELIPATEEFAPAKVFLSGDGKYLTLGSSNANRFIVMKRE